MIKFKRDKKKLVIPSGLGNQSVGGETQLTTFDETFTENGTYSIEKPEDADGYESGTVTVNIPDPQLEEKSVDMESAAAEVTADEGYYGLSKVSVDASAYGISKYGEGKTEGIAEGVEEQKAKLADTTIESNGTYEREDGWNKVEVNVHIPALQTKEVTLEGESAEITPDEGYEGMTSVSVDASEWGTQRYDAGKTAQKAEDDGKLEELNVTENGEYTPDYGYSKVTVDVPQTAARIDVATLGGAKFTYSTWTSIPTDKLDFSNITDFSNMFRENSNLTSIPDGIIVKPTNVDDMCYYARKITSIGTIDCSNLTSLKEAFYYNAALKTINLTNTSKVTNFKSAFYACTSIASIGTLDFAAIGNVSITGSNSYFYNTLPANSSSSVSITFANIKFSNTATNVTYNPFCSVCASHFDEATRQSFIDALYDYSEGDGHFMALNATLLANLTEDQIAQAAAKNWELN